VHDVIPVFTGAPAAGTPRATADDALPTLIEGDELGGTDANPVYQGNVALTRGDQFLGTDNMRYDVEAGTYVAEGNIRFQDSGIRVLADRATGDQERDTHRIDNVRYQLVSRRGNGGAESIDLRGPVGTLSASTYSTCDPKQRAWELRARRIEFDTDEGWGVARGATVRLGKVPILYVPWFKFPIDDRRHTGLLYPSISSSGRNGIDIRQPIYFNLAPHYDATLTPRYMSKRGLSLGGEFRYLYPDGRGVLQGTWMPKDDLLKRRVNDPDYGKYPEPDPDAGRGMFRYSGFHNLNRQWQARASLNWVSDERYLEDFSNSLYGISNTSVISTMGLYGRGRYWSGGVMADHWQLTDHTVAENLLPYSRLPRLYFAGEKPFGEWFSAGLLAETVRFQHTVRDGGSRVDLKPYVTASLQGPAWYVKPTLAWRYTGYQLERPLAETLDGERNPTRSMPIASLDAGLFFDRDVQWRGRSYLHTLEPRLFYLNVPYRDQSDLPLFDTRPFTFSWGQLFRDNRYSGPDRQTDANQLTLAMSSRFLRQADGHELLSASVGQIRYFEPSRVVVPGESPGDTGKSAWVADANYAPNDRWTIGASYQWDPKFRREDLASLRTRYLIGNDGVVNLNYRHRRNLLEQVDLSFLYPITPVWSVVGRYYYSLMDNKALESIAGVQWESCCLAMRLVARRYVRNREGQLNTAIQFELVLKGLGSAGQDTERTLRRAILGYYRDDLYLVPPSNATPAPDDDFDPNLIP